MDVIFSVSLPPVLEDNAFIAELERIDGVKVRISHKVAEKSSLTVYIYVYINMKLKYKNRRNFHSSTVLKICF